MSYPPYPCKYVTSVSDLNVDIVYAFGRCEYAFEKVYEGGGSHNSFSQMTVYPRRADLVHEWQAAMDPEKLTRVFVGNEGFDR